MRRTLKPARPALVFRPLAGGRSADEIQAQIRASVTARRVKSGDRLPAERDLAAQFAVSRNTVRQALRSLVDSGLLEMRRGANGGAFVRDGGGEAVLAGISDLYALGAIRPEHLTAIRLLVGVEAVRLACEHATEAELDELGRNVQAASQAARDGDIERRMTLNLEFYRILVRMTRNPLLVILTDAVTAVTERFVRDIGPASNASVMPPRRALLRCLRARDAAAAMQTMREHLLRLQRLYFAKLSRRVPDGA